MSEKKSVRIGSETLYYEIVEDTYAVIVSYDNDEDIALFMPDPDFSGWKTYHVHIPEEIEGYPVMAVKTFPLAYRKYGEGSYHQGNCLVVTQMPEGTSFSGYSPTTVGGMGGWFSPHYRVVSYPRKHPLLNCIEKGYFFFARKLDESSCEIYRIVKQPYSKQEVYGISFVLDVPAQIAGMQVRRIAKGATDGLPEKMSAVVLPACLEELEDDCFRNLCELWYVRLGGVKQLGENCFSYFRDMRYSPYDPYTLAVFHSKELQYPSSAFIRKTQYGEYKDYLDYEVLVSEHVERAKIQMLTQSETMDIAERRLCGVFDDASVITVPDGIEVIGHYAFASCTGVTEVILPVTLKRIETGAFQGCKNLKRIVIPDGVKWIGERAFCGCTSLTEIVMPKSLDTIFEFAFEFCDSLTVTAPEGSKAARWAAGKNLPLKTE